MIYYTVFDSKNKKIADCGNEEDAKWLANCRKGTYKTNRVEFNVTIDVESSMYKLNPEFVYQTYEYNENQIENSRKNILPQDKKDPLPNW